MDFSSPTRSPARLHSEATALLRHEVFAEARTVAVHVDFLDTARGRSLPKGKQKKENLKKYIFHGWLINK